MDTLASHPMSAAFRRQAHTASLDEVRDVRRSRIHWAFARITPYLGALAAIILVGVLLATMYLTWLSLEWTTFLSGILVAAILSITSRSARAEWLIARRTAQLTLARDKLAQEILLRTKAEQASSNATRNTKYFDETMPAMVAHLGSHQQIDYHNRAFRSWLGFSANRINGRPLRELVGGAAYADIERDIADAFSGKVVCRERAHYSAKGEARRMMMQYIPEFSDAGKLLGVLMLFTEINAAEGVASPATVQQPESPAQQKPAPPAKQIVAEKVEWEDTADRLKLALDRDEFCLYSQSIKALNPQDGSKPFREILLRLSAEEENMMPPGAFLPLAEEYGMLPDLDRWVVRNLLGWLGADANRQQGIYSINISPQTILDKDFVAAVQQELIANAVPGTVLCFELQETDISDHPAETIKFIRQLKQSGCRFAICGFVGKRASMDLLKLAKVDFIKIDGGLILNILRSPADLSRVKAIHAIACEMGIRTIAECVEDDVTLAKLHALGVNFAQGFGISRPRNFKELH